MRLSVFIIIVLALLVSTSTAAGPEPVPGFNEDVQQPQIIVRPSRSGKVQEYRMGGQLYMVKITPDKGPSYYLVDSDGDGNLETRRYNISQDFAVPQWTLKRWR